MNIWAIFVAFILLILWWIHSGRHPANQFAVEIEKQAKILAGLAIGILSFELASTGGTPLDGICIATILTVAVWVLVLHDKCDNSVWKWVVKLCLSIDAGYSALALGFGAFANKIPLSSQVFSWISLLFYACCYVFLVISIWRLVLTMRKKNP
jgi:hypothetical protein